MVAYKKRNWQLLTSGNGNRPHPFKSERLQPGAPRSQPPQEAPPEGLRRQAGEPHAQLRPQAGVPACLAETAAHQGHVAQPAQVDDNSWLDGLAVIV